MLLSAGFDAHERDPLADCRLTTGSFVEMALRVPRAFARRAGDRLGVVLEGGYNAPVLAECVLATLPALLGDGQPGPAPAPTPPEQDAAGLGGRPGAPPLAGVAGPRRAPGAAQPKNSSAVS